MSILIKGMEMPKNCGECSFICKESTCRYGKGYERSDFCPLVELPPHGRLIDADALKFDAYLEHDCIHKMMVFGGQMVYTESAIDDAPTIIEAEAPLWKRMVACAEEYGKQIPEETMKRVMQKVEAVICETVCIDKEDEDD